VILALVAALAFQCPDGTPPPCARVAAARALHPHGLAILYLDDLSRDTNDAAIADGLTEELIARLSQVSGLRVASRYAALRYRGRGASDPRRVGRELGVRYVLDGTLRRVGDRLRVVLVMTDASGGFNAWGQTYDRPMREIFFVEDSVAVHVAEIVLGQLSAQERAPLAQAPSSASIEAYQAYLRGRVAIRGRTAVAASAAVAHYRRALALDPEFARAWAGLAQSLALARDWGWRLANVRPDSVQPLADYASGRAVALDSTSAESWLAAAMAARAHDMRQSLVLHRRAVRLDSSDIEALHQLAWGYLGDGDLDSAIALERRVIERDPYYAYAYAGLAEMLVAVGRPTEALAVLADGRAVDSTNAPLYWEMSDAQLALRRLAEARVAIGQAEARGFDPTGVRMQRALALLLEGDTATVRAQLPGLERELDADSLRAAGGLAYHNAGVLSGVYAQLGDAEAAVRWARRVSPWPRRFYAVLFAHHWRWAPVRESPAFQAFLASLR